MIKKTGFGALILIVLMLAPGVQAIDYLYDCQGDTLVKTAELNISSNVYSYAQNITCPHGCEDGLTKYGADCLEPDYIITIEVIIGIALVFGFIFLVIRGKR